VTDPLRLRLLEALWLKSRSARELAERLYYHLGQMEQARLVRIAEYRPLPGGKVERVYAAATVEPPGDEATTEDMARFLGAVLHGYPRGRHQRLPGQGSRRGAAHRRPPGSCPAHRNEPPATQPRCGLDVAHAHPGRADQREHQVEAGQRDATKDCLGQDMPVPASRRRREQEQRGVGECRTGEHIRQPPQRGVDERERDAAQGEPAGHGQDQAGVNPGGERGGAGRARPALIPRLPRS